MRPHSSMLNSEISALLSGGKNNLVQQQLQSSWYLSFLSMYSKRGIALFLRGALPQITRYLSLSPYLGTSIGSIFSNLLAASPWAGQYLVVYLSSFTYLAKHNSLKFTSPSSSLFDYSKSMVLMELRSLVSMSLFKIQHMTFEVNGIPSLLTIYRPLPSQLGLESADQQLLPQYLFLEMRKRESQTFSNFISIGQGNNLVISFASTLPIQKVYLIRQLGRWKKILSVSPYSTFPLYMG